MQEANQSSLMSLEMEDYQKSLEALQNKLSEKEKALQDSLEEVSRVDKRADDFKTQIGEWKEKKTDLDEQLAETRHCQFLVMYAYYREKFHVNHFCEVRVKLFAWLDLTLSSLFHLLS